MRESSDNMIGVIILFGTVIFGIVCGVDIIMNGFDVISFFGMLIGIYWVIMIIIAAIQSRKSTTE